MFYAGQEVYYMKLGKKAVVSKVNYYTPTYDICVDDSIIIRDVPQEYLISYAELNSIPKGYLYTKDLKNKEVRCNFDYRYMLTIKKVHFSGGVTVVIFEDGTKTIVRCQDGEAFDPEKGLAMAICKKVLGTNKSGSNYYDVFKKWLPKEEKKVGPIDVTLNTGHSIVLDPDNPCVGCMDRKSGCLTDCQKMQDYAEGIREQSRPEPIKPGYFIEHDKERKEQRKKSSLAKEERLPLPLNMFVDKFDAALYPQEFLNFCKKNDLYFYIVDEIKGGLKKISPYTVSWQQVTGYLKKGLLESCKKVKYHKNTEKTYLAIKMSEALFSKIIKEDK